MSDTYLKPREYYEDIYDEGTVEQCRFLHHHKLEVTDKDIEDSDLSPKQAAEMKRVKGLWVDMVQEMAAFFAAAERFNKKESAIEEMMEKDRTKDHIMTNAEPPSKARCRKCFGHDLRIISKDLWDHGAGESTRVLFMFSCNKCDTNTAYYDDGEEWIVEPTRCPICNSEKLTFTKRNDGDTLTLSYVCSRCDNTWDEVHDFSTPAIEPEKPDPNYHEDRKLYCYSKKVRGWAEDLKRNPMTYSRPSWEENETEKLYKAELEKIEKLTVAQVDERLSKLLAQHNYKKFQLGQPDMDRELMVEFTVVDNKPDRDDEDSRRTVWKLINGDLEPTNWRLIRSSLNYRVGYVRGKLRAYENKLELEKLVDHNLKQLAKSRHR